MADERNLPDLPVEGTSGQPQSSKRQEPNKVYYPSTFVINNQAMTGLYDPEKNQLIHRGTSLPNSRCSAVIRVQPFKPRSVSQTQKSPVPSVSLPGPITVSTSGQSSVNHASAASPPLGPGAYITDVSTKYLSSVLDQEPRRKHESPDTGSSHKRSSMSYAKKRRIDKSGKGLRHFSMKVCEKVRCKGTTTYNEVADELVEEFTNLKTKSNVAESYDQKNIRRRVYDALNVLMAMNIISKEKKEINWIGLPTNSLQECVNLVNEKKQRMIQVKDKLKKLNELILQQICFRQLIERNKVVEAHIGAPSHSCRLEIPFVLVHTNKDTGIMCSISHDKSEYLLEFDDIFEICDDTEVLRQMNLMFDLDKGTCTPKNLEIAKTMVPKVLETYVVRLAQGQVEPILDDLKDDVEHVEKKAKTRPALATLNASVSIPRGSDSDEKDLEKEFIDHTQLATTRFRKHFTSSVELSEDDGVDE